jgi:tetratricopeptide (TPR) repeat protein
LRRVELGGNEAESRALRHKAAEIAQTRLNDPGKAIELYAGLFEDEPTDTAASRALRGLYERGENHQDLSRLLERLVDVATSPSDRGTLRMELATLRAERFSDIDTAIDLLRAVVDEEPTRTEAVLALGALYERGKRHEDLAALLDDQIAAARSRGDTDTELTFQVRVGEVHEKRLGDTAKAIETYEAILTRNPQHRGALEALIRLYQASGDHAAAARHLETLLGASAGADAQGLATTLAAEYRALSDLGRAASALERGLAVDPSNAPIRDALRALYEESGAWDKLAGIVAGDADIAGSPDEKVKLLRKAASIHAVKRNDHAASAELLEKACTIKPEDRELMLELCDAYSASGRGKAAVEVLEKIVASFGGKRSKELAEIHRRLSKAYVSDGDTARALDELDKAFRIEPGNVFVLKELGDVSVRVGDLKKAQQMFRALLLQKLEDGGPITKAQVFMNLGDVHLRLGEKPKAIQMLERAIQTDPALDQAKDLLAQAKA